MYAFGQMSDTSLISLTVQIDESTGKDVNIRKAKAENIIFYKFFSHILSSFACDSFVVLFVNFVVCITLIYSCLTKKKTTLI